MPSVLDDIVANKYIEVAKRQAKLSLDTLIAKVEATLNPKAHGRFFNVLQKEGLKLILEIKPSSPSGGVLREKLNLTEILDHYRPYATGISVLTDQKYFNGSLGLLSQVVSQVQCPVLCKDFIVTSYQVYEAKQAGASAVLLIVKILTDEVLSTLHTLILSLGMTPIVEVQDEPELTRANQLNPQVILINNRNLQTFEIDLNTTHRLAPLVSNNAVIISASGIQTRTDIERLLPDCSSFLIGSTLMKSTDIQLTLEELVTA